MAIKLYHPIIVDIEGKCFSVEVRELLDADIVALEELTRADISSAEARQELNRELMDIHELIAINAGLIECESDFVKKGSLYSERLSLVKKRMELEKKLPVRIETTDLSHIYKKRFDLTVRGRDKDALEKEIKTLGIGYKVVMDDITEGLKEAKEKKYSSSSASSR